MILHYDILLFIQGVKIMVFDKFISEVPSTTKELVLKAIEVYAVLRDKDLVCNVSELFSDSSESKTLNKIDKRCISLFLASLLVEGDIKRIMEDSQVTALPVFNFLGINEKDVKSLTSNQYLKYYEEDFKLLLGKIKRSQGIQEFSKNQNFHPEVIISNLAFGHIIGTNVIDWVYRDAKWEEIHPIFNHSSYLMLNELKEQKLKSKPEKENKPNISRPILTLNDLLDEQEKVLESYGEFLTDKKYKTNPAIGRDKEMRNLFLTLLTPNKSAILVGESGVGKTALVEGLAHLINSKKVPEQLKDMEIVKVNVSTLLMGCTYMGMFEKRVETLVEELRANPSVILFIDEVHNVIGAGSNAKNNLDFANILKPYLDRGQIKIIGATTNEEYEQYILSDSAFRRRFEKITVLEPSELVVSEILKGVLPKIEKATSVKFAFNFYEQEKLIDYIVTCSNKKHRVYNDKINNPDLSLTILKKAFAFALLNSTNKLQIEHIAKAIENCESINESTRKRKARILIDTYNKQEIGEDIKDNVIPFPLKKRPCF